MSQILKNLPSSRKAHLRPEQDGCGGDAKDRQHSKEHKKQRPMPPLGFGRSGWNHIRPAGLSFLLNGIGQIFRLTL
jgi:hypothetical protein